MVTASRNKGKIFKSMLTFSKNVSQHNMYMHVGTLTVLVLTGHRVVISLRFFKIFKSSQWLSTAVTGINIKVREVTKNTF